MMNTTMTGLKENSEKNLHVVENRPKRMQVWRGEIFYADLSGNIGSEQGGIRPVLVVQNDIGNTYSPTTIVVMITSEVSKSKLPTHLEISSIITGLNSDSLVLFEQIRTVDKRRLRERICKLDELTMQKVDKALDVSIKAHKLKQPIDKLPRQMKQIINKKLNNIYHYEGLLNEGEFRTPSFGDMVREEYIMCLEDLKMYCNKNNLNHEDYYTETLDQELNQPVSMAI